MLAFLDYDGTLTTHECNEIVLQRFVGDAWRPLEAEAQADRMSHAEVFDRQIGLIQAPRAELIGALVAEAEPAPGLAAFLAELEARGGRPMIVSAGLREAIAAVWSREQLPPVELYASELVGGGPEGGPPYRLAFSDVLGDCPRCGPKSLQRGGPASVAPPRRARARLRRRRQRPVPRARSRPYVRARPPRRALRRRGPRVAAAGRLRDRVVARSTPGRRGAERRRAGF